MPQHPALSKGGVAVITGGASGIGLAAAHVMAERGYWRVKLLARSPGHRRFSCDQEPSRNSYRLAHR